MSSPRFFKVESCKACPNLSITRGPGGSSDDWWCLPGRKIPYYGDIPKAAKQIGGYIENPSEQPTDIPKWCPLPKEKK